MRVMRAWHECPKWKLAIGAAAKCGSTMLAQLVQTNKAARLPLPDARYGRIDWSLVPRQYRKVFVVRHPVERFASLYANVQQRKRSDDNFYKQFEGLSPWDFLQKLIDKSPDLSYDFHFQPQVAACGALEGIEFVRLENFDDWWRWEYPASTPPQKTNESDGVPSIDDRTAARVVNRYATDHMLWENAWASSTSLVSALQSRT